MIRLLTCVMAVLTLLAATASVSAAKPKIVVTTKYYTITGSTARELKNQMKRKGPRGYWAYTSWYVSWSAKCQTTVKLSYEYPKWQNRNLAPVALQAKWDRMIEALMKHEKQHGQHGVNAANEIEKTNCAGNPKSITSKWANQDRIFDAQTNHGKNQGVVLP